MVGKGWWAVRLRAAKKMLIRRPAATEVQCQNAADEQQSRVRSPPFRRRRKRKRHALSALEDAFFVVEHLDLEIGGSEAQVAAADFGRRARDVKHEVVQDKAGATAPALVVSRRQFQRRQLSDSLRRWRAPLLRQRARASGVQTALAKPRVRNELVVGGASLAGYAVCGTDGGAVGNDCVGLALGLVVH